NLWAKYSGAIEAGALSVCPDEWPDEFRPATAAVSGWDDNTVLDIGEVAEYNAAAVEAALREVTGLGDDWELLLNEVDAEASDKDYITFCFINRDVNGEGRTLTVGCEVNIKATVAAPAKVPGDINGDGVCNSKDLTRLMRYLSGEDVEVNVEALDVNGDGKVNSKDLTRLLKYTSGEDVEIF
ncbi:MAG: dockerin type I repeat-containing protein, partial [Clostridia bacterium]|nr:dockerin type I repeat-containing protein [Clostridia bacterium]